VINRNDFTPALKRIDGDTSDYYVLGYYSTNADRSKKRRAIESAREADKRRTEKYELFLQDVLHVEARQILSRANIVDMPPRPSPLGEFEVIVLLAVLHCAGTATTPHGAGPGTTPHGAGSGMGVEIRDEIERRSGGRSAAARCT
jgi:hypothetical protein